MSGGRWTWSLASRDAHASTSPEVPSFGVGAAGKVQQALGSEELGSYGTMRTGTREQPENRVQLWYLKFRQGFSDKFSRYCNSWTCLLPLLPWWFCFSRCSALQWEFWHPKNRLGDNFLKIR